MSIPPLTPDLLRRYIKDVELPERSASVPQPEAETILRKGGFVGSSIEHRAVMGRAMDQARAHINRRERDNVSVSSGALFLADQLSSSKGRFIRQWHAPLGGLWGAMIYVSTVLPQTRLLLPFAVGVACCEALHRTGVANAELRWVNDVLIDGRKVAGILMEGFCGAVSKEEYTLIGFGINLNNSDFPLEIREVAVCAKEYLGRPVDLQTFACCFLAKLTWNIGLLVHVEDCLLSAGNLPAGQPDHPLVARWCLLSKTIGRRVLFGFDVETSPQYQAIVTGISETGGLRLKLDDGSETVEHSGEIRYL
ncbi:MAG: biotin--[acetyl-CoA-carboxylase] ligase [Desulfocapsaceae bacterium]|nr:biotin--[acetyl-CoA-carboxylase] ligase [Desulfocapsaceae bacterium]